MQYLKYTYVDAISGISIAEAPAVNGPKAPEIEGLSFSFAAESQYPTTVPLLFGTAPDDADTGAAGVLDVLDAAGYEAARVAELDARKAIKQRRRVEALEAAREAGFDHGGATVASDIKSQMLIQGSVQLAQMALADGSPEALDAFATSLGAGWRAADGTVVATDAAGIVAMAQSLAAHIAACDGVSQGHKTMIGAAADFAELAAIDVSAGYPGAEAQ